MMAQYKSLTRAQLSYDYLHTNSTTHEFLFGALAELLDNARDASATKINIYSVPDEAERGGYLLSFLDDGEGMSPDEAADIITFGKSTKKSLESSMIGMYGNGLKSGSMRIGNDFILFTKKGPTMTCVFLSRTFHEEEGIDEIVVPMPSFDSQTKKPITRSPREKERHQIEMSLILKYSPFKTEAQFMKEFDKIEGNSGTLVTVYNLKLLDSGISELDVKTDAYDILLSNPEGGDFDSDEGLMPERKSFRAYASILYVDPRMRIYIQGKKVRTKRLASCLFKPRMYKYSSGRFKTRSENEVKKAEEESRIANNRAKEAESKARNLEIKIGDKGTKEQRAELRRSQAQAAELRKEAQIKKQIADRKAKSLREPKTLNFIFGLNIDNRNQDGMFVYNCSRLIKMYQKVGPQADGGVFCSGVIGLVDVPYLVLEPTHNKQDFADAKEYRHLQKAMGEHMVQYWKDLGIAQTGVTKFWENFGYISPNWRDQPSADPKFIRKRAMQVQVSLQCDLCLKWRILPFSANNIGKTFPDDWVCSMNPEPSHNRCSAPEQKMNLPEGLLKKETKSREQKEKDLEEDIRKKQEQLEKIQKTKPSLPPGRELREYDANRPKPDYRSSSSTNNTPSRSPARPTGQGSFGKRIRHVSESDDEEDDFSDGEVVVETIKRKKITPPPKLTVTPRSRNAGFHRKSVFSTIKSPRSSRKRSSRKDSTDDSEEEEKKPRKPHRAHLKKTTSGLLDDTDDNLDDAEPDDGSPMYSTASVGSKVEVKVSGKWSNGVIVEVNKKLGKWKVKLDKHPQDKHDKWYESDSSDVRLHKLDHAEVVSTAESRTNDNISSEIPSSSTASGSTTTAQFTEDIANGYRTCLRYFLPPQWVIDKEVVSVLTLKELASFPLDDFFDHYEKGLRKLVSSFQLEAQSRQQEAEQHKNKLSSVRKMIAKLLKSINEEFDIDPECDTDQVDELLSLCVKQATQGQVDGKE